MSISAFLLSIIKILNTLTAEHSKNKISGIKYFITYASKPLPELVANDNIKMKGSFDIKDRTVGRSGNPHGRVVIKGVLKKKFLL